MGAGSGGAAKGFVIISGIKTGLSNQIGGIHQGGGHQIQLRSVVAAPLAVIVAAALILFFIEHVRRAHGDHIAQSGGKADRAVPFVTAGKDDHAALAAAPLGLGPVQGVGNHLAVIGTAPAVGQHIAAKLPGIVNGFGDTGVIGAAPTAVYFHRQKPGIGGNTGHT